MKGAQKKPSPALEAFQAGAGLVKQNPVLSGLMERAVPRFDDSYPMARED